MVLRWDRTRLLYDLSTMCWVLAKSSEDGAYLGALEMLRDVCQNGNADRVSRVFTGEMAYVRDLLQDGKICEPEDVCNEMEEQDFAITARVRDDAQGKRIVEEVHALLVESALADWLRLTLGEKRAREYCDLRDNRREALKNLVQSIPQTKGKVRLKMSPF